MAFPENRFRRSWRIAAAAVAVLVICAAGSASAREPEAVRLFGTSEKANLDLSQFPKWTGVLERYEQERSLEDAPCHGACALQHWKQFLAGLQGKDRRQQLDAVNRYLNQTPYETDPSRYGVEDYWATPAEFIGRSGDCEDYAIAKYVSLRHLGWDAGDLRLLVLNDELRRELHAVLIAYVDGTAYVLDNLSPAVVEHTAVAHYRPIFSINETTWYLHEGWSPGGTAVAAARRARGDHAESDQPPAALSNSAPAAAGAAPSPQDSVR